MRVLETGEVDEAYEEVFERDGTPRETITRKNRLTLDCGTTYLVGVMHDVTEVFSANRLLEEQSSKLRELVNTDWMTGCMNRRSLFETFETMDTKGGLLIMDIDFFKKINDNYGHDAGDAAIMHFAQVIKSQLRDCDLLARVGGEEFAVFLPGIDAEAQSEHANRIRSAVENNALVLKDQHISMTVSIGGTFTDDASKADLNELLKKADSCLYAVKYSGRNSYKIAA